MLHNEKSLFEQVILRASEYLGISEAIIEKDYYVTLFLKELVKTAPNIIFKGGTSLSKCHHLIKSINMLEGNLPSKALALVKEWAEQHRDELMKKARLTESKAGLPIKGRPVLFARLHRDAILGIAFFQSI